MWAQRFGSAAPNGPIVSRPGTDWSWPARRPIDRDLPPSAGRARRWREAGMSARQIVEELAGRRRPADPRPIARLTVEQARHLLGAPLPDGAIGCDLHRSL